jgi:hypothetical protein
MKKSIYFILSFAFAFQVQAQEDNRLGIKFGANLSTVSGDDLDSDFLFGYHIGGFAEINFSDKLTFAPEMLFSIQGYQSSISETIEFGGFSTSAEGEEELRLSYLNFPLMMRYNITESLFAEAGPQIGFLMGAKLESSSESSIESPGFDEDGESITITEVVQETTELNVRDRYNDIDFGVSLGAGGHITDNFLISLRYYLGLSEIDSTNMGFSNQVIMLSFGFRF